MSKNTNWTFLTNHMHVIVCLYRQREITVRQMALDIGITERSVQRILTELAEDDVIEKIKSGRNNQYIINMEHKLRHPLEAQHTVGELLEILS